MFSYWTRGICGPSPVVLHIHTLQWRKLESGNESLWYVFSIWDMFLHRVCGFNDLMVYLLKESAVGKIKTTLFKNREMKLYFARRSVVIWRFNPAPRHSKNNISCDRQWFNKSLLSESYWLTWASIYILLIEWFPSKLCPTARMCLMKRWKSDLMSHEI